MSPIEFHMETLLDRLVNLFFEENISPFQIFYDKNKILKKFFQNQKDNLNDYKIIIIKSSNHPREFINREEIVNDFNEKLGWYEHNWIIYVYGDFIEEIERFDSFLYYSRIGKVHKFQNFTDFLLNLNFINFKNEDSYLEQEPLFYKILASKLMNIPLSCFITKGKNFSESASWMVFLLDYYNNFNPDEDISQIWSSKVNTSKLFNINDVIIELIRIYDFDDFNVSEEEPHHLIKNVFKFIEKELDFKGINSSRDDFFGNMKNIIQYISPIDFKISKKKENITIDKFVLQLNQKLLKRFSEIRTIWINSSDKGLKSRFKQWMEILRKDFPIDKLDDKNYEIILKKFSFSGIYDIWLMKHLLITKNEISTDQLKERIKDFIEKRKSLWTKYAPAWWNENALFYFHDYSISLENVWNYVLAIKMIISSIIEDNKEWIELESFAWELEQFHNHLINPVMNKIIENLDSFKFFRDYISEAEENYNDYNQELNRIFSKFYLNSLSKSNENLISNTSKILLDKAISNLREDFSVAIFFCDSLRRDISNKLVDIVKEKLSKISSRIKQRDIIDYSTYCFIPTKTDIGWSSILSFNNDLIINPIYSKKEMKDIDFLIKESEKNLLHLRLKEERESRLKTILENSGKKINIISMEYLDFSEQITLYNLSNSKDDFCPVPVIWFSKFDDHDKRISEFYNEVDNLLEKISNVIYELHLNGINYIYIFSDHGFIFGDNSKLLDDKPQGILHNRYCLSNKEFLESDIKKYNKWNILNPLNYGLKLKEQLEPHFSIIIPKDNYLFRKMKTNKQFVHGGLSFQEANLNLSYSYCELSPVVSIASIKPIDHKISPGFQDVFELKENKDQNYLKIQVIGSKPSSKSEKFKSERIKIIADNNKIFIEPNKEKLLRANSKLNYELFFNKAENIREISITVVNSNNRIIAKKVFKVKTITYDIGL